MEASVPYPKMYAILCGAMSDSVELLDAEKIEEAKQTLLSALERTETLYIDAE